MHPLGLIHQLRSRTQSCEIPRAWERWPLVSLQTVVCDVVPLHLILHNLHFHVILCEDCGPGREGLRLHTQAGTCWMGFHLQGPVVSALF